jgi:ABC-type bacteriocin/lantibiotic exporter with double-glycine peptidase domain
MSNIYNMSIYDTVFGPLDSDFCNIFYILMIVTFIYLILNILGMIAYMFNNKKKDSKINGLFFTNIVGTAIAYFTHRTLYSMCISTLR